MDDVMDLNASQCTTTHANGFAAPDCDVAIIGAGPYGLSAAVHLKAKGLEVLVFGKPMEFWATTMPEGMLLRSHRRACNISDPNSAFTLSAYEAESGVKPAAPVPLRTFVDYGRWFTWQLGSSLDQNSVTCVHRLGSRFSLTLENGSSVSSRRVVVAAGIGSFQNKPEPFAQLPPSVAFHCYEGRQIADLAGKKIAVIGAGQSALESAALLHEMGAYPEVIAKTARLRWVGRHGWLHHLGPISHLLYSKHDVGHAGLSRLVGAPMLVLRIPLPVRDKIRARAIRPAGAGWLQPRLSAVKISTGRTVQSARCVGEELELRLDDGSERRIHHVLLGTGYRVDISRYTFLSPELLGQVQRSSGYPQLTSGFASSVPGLHFIGAPAARTFGPLLCFVAGTEFASRHLTSHIGRA